MYPSLEPQQWAYQKNDLLLLDAGIETDDMYTADITRSIPVSGKILRLHSARFTTWYALHKLRPSKLFSLGMTS